jgi:hypothetical protein
LSLLYARSYLVDNLAGKNHAVPGGLALIVVDCERKAAGRYFTPDAKPRVSAQSANQLLLFLFLLFWFTCGEALRTVWSRRKSFDGSGGGHFIGRRCFVVPGRFWGAQTRVIPHAAVITNKESCAGAWFALLENYTLWADVICGHSEEFNTRIGCRYSRDARIWVYLDGRVANFKGLAVSMHYITSVSRLGAECLTCFSRIKFGKTFRHKNWRYYINSDI